VIESYPLQAYASALVFSPTSSLIRTFFEEQEAPKWIITKPFIQDGWDACVSTLELPDISWGAQVAWSPSGAQLAFSQNNTIYLLDPTTCQYIRTLKGHKGKIICIAWASNSLQLASASKDRTVKIWDPVTGQCTATLDQVNADVIAWIPNTARLASGGADGEVGIWDSTTSTCLQTFQGHEDRVWSLAVSPNGNWLAAGFRTKIEIWDLANKIHHATFEHEDGQVNGIESISWSPCSTRFASGRGISCGVWDLGTRTCVKEFGFGAKVVTWSPNETRPALAATQGRIKILDPTTLEETATLKSHDIIQNISWSPNGSLLASITMKTLQIWDATVGRNAPKLKIDAHTSWVHTMAVSANGAHLATASHDTTIMVWELATGKCISKLTHHFGHPYILAWSPANHNQLASATWDPCEVKIWDVMTHQCIATRSFPAHRLQDLAWSQDGGKLALSLKCYGLITERRVDIWDPTATESDGVETLPLTVDTYDGSFSVNWSPDGTLLAVAGNKFICLWDLATKQCIRMFDHHRADIFRLSWSPNGDILASRAQRSVDVWDPTTGQRVFTIDDIDNFCSFRFDTLNPHLLHTNVGTFELYPGSSESPSSGPPKPPFRHVGYGINKEKTWITYQGENVLWLPSEYRPFVSELVDSHTIALGYENGWVHFLGFSPTNPPV
jgi:WD40 repeat protein